MLNSDIVEVAIGLAFMYFVLSLVCRSERKEVKASSFIF